MAQETCEGTERQVRIKYKIDIKYFCLIYDKMADKKTMEEYAKSIQEEHGKTIEELYGAKGFGYNWDKLSDVDRAYWNYAESIERFEPFNSANGETWKDYQARQKKFLVAQENHLCAYYKKLKDADYQAKKRAKDTDEHREEINAKRREKYKADKGK